MKQCVDPKLNNDYPPKAIAKVCSFILLSLQLDYVIYNILLRLVTDYLTWIYVVGCCGSTLCSV